MNKDAFLSYASADQHFAFLLCRLLEERGIACWIAPRDLPPGADYGEAILDAIEATPTTLLILSASANASVHVTHEVERATSKRKRVIPVRLEDVQPGRSMELHLAATQWVDAWLQPVDQLAEQLATVLRRDGSKPPGSSGQRRALSVNAKLGKSGCALSITLALAVLVVSLLALASHVFRPATTIGPAEKPKAWEQAKEGKKEQPRHEAAGGKATFELKLACPYYWRQPGMRDRRDIAYARTKPIERLKWKELKPNTKIAWEPLSIARVDGRFNVVSSFDVAVVLGEKVVVFRNQEPFVGDRREVVVEQAKVYVTHGLKILNVPADEIVTVVSRSGGSYVGTLRYESLAEKASRAHGDLEFYSRREFMQVLKMEDMVSGEK